ncbi:hypothetical protein [Mycobacterium montefiorense]|uniref:Uncharacterized protein n=1 Tax=Mycobacterium montefiorense TaxID=154654 RepID=A0AA37UVF3_9MYCO|nr:hypothetical protein [Mycobacterium montefiorense]GBG39625.1 hypothetical protein MmonteBS_39970 [Mycobacterium montefiorense]GKU35496.1 hypothetical protein NJB14191_28420 [Mycobacterium montefiorense]GKU40501.1 hypothetical protein NJB14192_24880 [Mycobacterium montefiorense]GKU45004.1 hypothetical protein NJB14194_16280 [Mycobacterium montefiorense]GKU51154.1 hypothetical protein NJB14195_24000 [Mycobacterium montefiorense]
MSGPLSDLEHQATPVTGFDYRPQPGVLGEWSLRVSGYEDDDLNGQLDLLPPRGLVEVESTIELWEEEYAEETGAHITRIHGGYGWREFEWDNGTVHRYEWEHVLIDLRCQLCMRPQTARIYMVTDELWERSGLEGWPCWRCLEKAVGRRLVPADFKPGVPCNSAEANHEPELFARIGLIG